MDLEHLHNVELEALRRLREICDSQGIRFFLIAGTALGAVRHGGFIPWDDDIDIGVTYSDYEKLDTVLCSTDLTPYQYISCSNSGKYPRLHGKILYEGRNCIDLFPLIRLSDSPFLARVQWCIRKITWKVYSRKVGYLHEKEKQPWIFISQLLALFLSKERVLKIADWNCRLCEGTSTNCYINIYSTYSMEKEKILSSCVEDAQKILFEGETFWTFGHLDAYLKHLYGDYRKLPPEHERKGNAHEELF